MGCCHRLDDNGLHVVCPCGYEYIVGLDDMVVEARSIVLRQLEPGRMYSVMHFDPVAGSETDGGTFTADMKGEFQLPAPNHGHDWAVLVKPLP